MKRIGVVTYRERPKKGTSRKARQRAERTFRRVATLINAEYERHCAMTVQSMRNLILFGVNVCFRVSWTGNPDELHVDYPITVGKVTDDMVQIFERYDKALIDL